jgi:halocyanin-like protein
VVQAREQYGTMGSRESWESTTMTEDDAVLDRAISRRTALRTAAGAAGGALAAGAAGTAAAQQEGPDFGGWFDGVQNFDGVVDRTGQDEVEVTVGAENGNTNLGFGPAAIRVDPGTTVRWVWNGEGGAHNVVADDGSFRSGNPVLEAGTEFTHTFESAGITKYYCTPHQQQGMKGAVVVADTGGATAEPEYGNWFDGVQNFDGTVDETGADEVTVTVGAPNGDTNLGFGPAAIRVDPGTTVVWEWNGKGGAHNVAANDGSFRSGEAVSEAGTTFSYTFEEPGLYRYVCEPHAQLGMKGAVFVPGGGGDAGPTRPVGIPPALYGFGGVLFFMLLTPVMFGVFLKYRYPEGVPEDVARGAASSAETTYESATEDESIVQRLGHDDFDPTGTLSLVLVYMAILAFMWVFMYFFEFLGGPTVIG